MSAQYFARIDENNVVIDVAVVTAQFMAENPERYPGTWIETFWNTPGKTYAGLSYIWNEEKQDFDFPPEPVEP